jgi:hypothetical protein
MAYTESNLVNPMSAFDYTLMLMIKITGESMTGQDHYRAAERFLEEAKSGDDSSSRAAWCLELAKLHVALAQVAATAIDLNVAQALRRQGHAIDAKLLVQRGCNAFVQTNCCQS